MAPLIAPQPSRMEDGTGRNISEILKEKLAPLRARRAADPVAWANQMEGLRGRLVLQLRVARRERLAARPQLRHWS